MGYPVARRLLVTLVAALVLGAAGGALAGEAPVLEPLLREQLGALDTHDLEVFLDDLNREMQGLVPALDLGDILALYRGGGGLEPWALLRGLLHYLFREIVAHAALLGKLVVLAVICALLQNLQSAFGGEATGKVAYAVVYLVLIGLALTGFALAIETAKEVIDRLTGYMLAVIPLLLTLLAGMGGLVSAGIFHPLMVIATHTIAQGVVTVIFPLLYLAAALDIAGGLGAGVRLSGLAGLLRQSALVLLGLGFTVFLGVMAVKGAAGAVADGVTLRTAKFLAGTFIPVVGKMFADAAELIIGSSILLKNAVGLLGAAGIFAVIAFPLLKIAALIFVYRLAAALIQPLAVGGGGAGDITATLNTMAQALTLVFVAVAVVALMFFVSVTVIVGAGNVTVMLR